MFDTIRGFISFNNFFHYNRDIDEDQEEIWDLMICGRAAGAKQQVAKHFVLSYLVNIILSVVTYFAIGSAATANVENNNTTGTMGIIFFALLLVFSTISYIVFHCINRFSPKVKFLLSLAGSFVIGLIFAIIAIIIVYAMA